MATLTGAELLMALSEKLQNPWGIFAFTNKGLKPPGMNGSRLVSGMDNA